jgi:hypothetical protein
MDMVVVIFLAGFPLRFCRCCSPSRCSFSAAKTFRRCSLDGFPVLDVALSTIVVVVVVVAARPVKAFRLSGRPLLLL